MARNLGYLAGSSAEKLLRRAAELGRVLNGLLRSLVRQQLGTWTE